MERELNTIQMINNFKGSKLPWYSDNDTVIWGAEINKRVCIFDRTSTFTGNGFANQPNEEYKHNKQLLMDASVVRQKIDCSLPELLERFEKMESALQKVWNKVKLPEQCVEYGNIKKEVNEALNLNK